MNVIFLIPHIKQAGLKDRDNFIQYTIGLFLKSRVTLNSVNLNSVS